MGYCWVVARLLLDRWESEICPKQFPLISYHLYNVRSLLQVWQLVADLFALRTPLCRFCAVRMAVGEHLSINWRVLKRDWRNNHCYQTVTTFLLKKKITRVPWFLGLRQRVWWCLSMVPFSRRDLERWTMLFHLLVNLESLIKLSLEGFCWNISLLFLLFLLSYLWLLIIIIYHS